MKTLTYLAVAWMWFALVVTFVPQPRPQPGKWPKLPKACQWGIITQQENRVIITGGDTWTAEGEILKNGKIVLIWRTLSSNKEAPSVYTFKDGLMRGEWGWETNGVEVDGMGNITGGPTSLDVFREPDE